MCIFLVQKKYGIWGDFSEQFQVLCKNPDEVKRFDGIDHLSKLKCVTFAPKNILFRDLIFLSSLYH